MARIFPILVKFSVDQSEPNDPWLRNPYETQLALAFLNTNRGVRHGT
jgi:hypothetical protein